MIEINPKAYLKMKYLTEKCDSEIYGLILGEKRDEEIYVEDIKVTEQEAHGAGVELDTDKLAEFVDDSNDNESVIGWWHSHVDMSPFYSSTDDDNIERLMQTQNFIVSLVTSRRNGFEIKTRVDYRALFDVENEEDIEFWVDLTSDKLEEKCDELIEEKVDNKSFKRQKNWKQREAIKKSGKQTKLAREGYGQGSVEAMTQRVAKKMQKKDTEEIEDENEYRDLLEEYREYSKFGGGYYGY